MSWKTIITACGGAIMAFITAGGVPTTWYQWAGLVSAVAGAIAALKTTPPGKSVTPDSGTIANNLGVLVLVACSLGLASCSSAQEAQLATNISNACHVASAVEAADPTLINANGKTGSKIVAGETLVCTVAPIVLAPPATTAAGP